MATVTPLTPQDVADAVNSLGIDKATFETFLAGAALLQQRNQVMAQIQAAQAAGATQANATAGQIAALQTQLAAIDASYQHLVTGS